VPDLDMHGWDEAQTGVDFPLDAWERTRVAAWRRKAVPSTEIPASGIRLLDQTYEDTFSVLGDGVGYHWSLNAAALPYWERAAPLIHIIHWWQRAHGVYLMHAGAVGRDGRAVLLVGPSGSGKSTSALSCRRAGWQYVGDDYTLVDPAAMRVHHLYCSAKLGPKTDGLVADAPAVPADGRQMYFLDGCTDQLDVVAVVAPTVGERRENRLTALASGFGALAALAPSTINQLPGSGAPELAAMRRVCTSVPCFSLELGGPTAQIPAVLEEALG
jgi:hypothetical protein